MASPDIAPHRQTSARAWLALLGASLALFCTVGFLNAFGVFQEYYTTYLHGQRSSSDISWIGSLSIFLLYAGSPFGGLLVDRIGPTIPLCVGSVGLLLSLFMTSLCTQYWQLMLAQSLLLGLSASLVFCPPLGVVLRHMPHRRGLAMGLTIGGSSIGGIVWPIMLQQLLNKGHVSFGWTIRAVAFTMMPLLALACFTIVEPVKKPALANPSPSKPDGKIPRPADDSLNKNATDDSSEKTSTRDFLKTPTYMLLCAGLALAYLGLFTPLFYISSYAIAQGQAESTAFYLLSAVNASSFFGRVVPGHLADVAGHYNLVTTFTLVSGLVGFTWTKAKSLAGLIVWGLAYGFTSGAVMSLQGACAGKIAPPQHQGLAVGFLMGCLSIAGQILDHSGYLALSMWTGATLIGGGLILGLARLMTNPHLTGVF
ncbi:mfs monocarboxylate transporter [Apiospora rasikravindrae]|uniref:Mfs monocarboxylate transporter n=1 Tax=Apiospora rasikravindrae TaxID=990691 RepID=A0ABR1T4X9_9PEZI